MRLWLNKITNKLMGIYHKFPNQKYKINYAFTCGSVDFYEFDDIFNLPYQRALKATAAYEELRMKCTFEYLQWHQKAINEELSGIKFNAKNLARLTTLNNQLGERLSKWAIDLNHVYRLASIVYFDKSEKPEIYDFKYANEKIERWKKEEGIQSFFLKQPIRKLIPFLDAFQENFQIYSEVIKQMDMIHLESLRTSLSEKQRTDFNAYASNLYAEGMSQN